MAEPYTFTDDDGDRLEVRASSLTTDVLAVSSIGTFVRVEVPAGRRAEFAAALWPEAQGPIILDRVAVNPRTGYHQAGWGVELHDDGQIYVCDRGFTADDALELAAVVAAFAQHALWAPEPDEADVERLAALIAEAYAVTPEELAHTLLREGVTFKDGAQ